MRLDCIHKFNIYIFTGTTDYYRVFYRTTLYQVVVVVLRFYSEVLSYTMDILVCCHFRSTETYHRGCHFGTNNHDNWYQADFNYILCKFLGSLATTAPYSTYGRLFELNVSTKFCLNPNIFKFNAISVIRLGYRR